MKLSNGYRYRILTEKFQKKENFGPVCMRHSPQGDGDASLKLPVCAGIPDDQSHPGLN